MQNLGFGDDDDDAGVQAYGVQENLIHLRLTQRSGRKTITTVEGIIIILYLSTIESTWNILKQPIPLPLRPLTNYTVVHANSRLL